MRAVLTCVKSASVTVDGKQISGNVLPIAAAGTKVTVEVTLG